jgi:hypothetical protein
MEQLCAPTRRYQEVWELGRDDDEDFQYTEVELTVPVEDFLIYYWDWKDLRSFLTGGATPKLLWITTNLFLVVSDDENLFDFDDEMPHSCISADFQETSGQYQILNLAQLHHAEISTGEVSVFWRAVATSNIVELTLLRPWDSLIVLPSGPILSKILRESTALQDFHLHGFHVKEEHCRALETLQRTDLKIKLSGCTIKPEGDAFIEWFRNNKVVTELDHCYMDSSIISALSGNNSVKDLAIDTKACKFGEEKMLSLCQALPGNMGIECLTIIDAELSDETCRLIFRSLAMHPRIKSLYIDRNYVRYSAESDGTTMKAIIQMLHLNTVVESMRFFHPSNNGEVYQNSILPRLEMNRSCFEVQRQAVKRADPSIRPQLLGRALHAVRYNANLVFRFLSENVPAFVRIEEKEESITTLELEPAIASGQKRKAPS